MVKYLIKYKTLAKYSIVIIQCTRYLTTHHHRITMEAVAVGRVFSGITQGVLQHSVNGESKQGVMPHKKKEKKKKRERGLKCHSAPEEALLTLQKQWDYHRRKTPSLTVMN